METANYLRITGREPRQRRLYPRAVDVSTLPNKAEAYTHWGIALANSGRAEKACRNSRPR